MQAGCCEVKRRERNMALCVTEIRSGSDWHFIVNKHFMQEFYSKRGFYERNFIGTCQAVLANSNWRLGFWSESLENSLMDGIVQSLCISVVKTFGTGFDNCESIFWALVESGQDFVEVVDTSYSGALLNTSDLSWSVSTEIVSNNLAIGAEQLRDRYFFSFINTCYMFCEFPPGAGLWGFYWGRYSETGVWR